MSTRNRIVGGVLSADQIRDVSGHVARTPAR
jgi:hypothetical protein